MRFEIEFRRRLLHPQHTVAPKNHNECGARTDHERGDFSATRVQRPSELIRFDRFSDVVAEASVGRSNLAQVAALACSECHRLYW